MSNKEGGIERPASFLAVPPFLPDSTSFIECPGPHAVCHYLSEEGILTTASDRSTQPSNLFFLTRPPINLVDSDKIVADGHHPLDSFTVERNLVYTERPGQARSPESSSK